MRHSPSELRTSMSIDRNWICVTTNSFSTSDKDPDVDVTIYEVLTN